MKEQFHRGRVKYVSFILLDLLCLLASNALAVWFYGSFVVRTVDFSAFLLYPLIVLLSNRNSSVICCNLFISIIKNLGTI